MTQVFHRKQETNIDFSEARLEAAVEKMCAGYQSIRNAKKTKEHCNVESQQFEEQDKL